MKFISILVLILFAFSCTPSVEHAKKNIDPKRETTVEILDNIDTNLVVSIVDNKIYFLRPVSSDASGEVNYVVEAKARFISDHFIVVPTLIIVCIVGLLVLLIILASIVSAVNQAFKR